MKKVYEAPEMKIVKVDDNTDIICTSSTPQPQKLFNGETGADAGSTSFDLLK